LVDVMDDWKDPDTWKGLALALVALVIVIYAVFSGERVS
tara:strand:- start:961 stop:1077 length:117 start_codon:yes stop_codon:yes gene_type:complete